MRFWDRAVLKSHGLPILEDLAAAGCEIRGDDAVRGIFPAAKAATEGYPPYNVEARDSGGVRITGGEVSLRTDKDEQHWRTTMDHVRLGLGADIESINARADPGGGRVALTLKRYGIDKHEPAAERLRGRGIAMILLPFGVIDLEVLFHCIPGFLRDD